MRKWGLGILVLLGAVFASLAWNWDGGAQPSEARLIDAIEEVTGPLPVRALATAGLAWSRAKPRLALEVDTWMFRLRLDAYDPEPTDADVRVTQFLDFTENDRVETAWPNGSFYDWRLLGRPSGLVARLRAWWER